MEMGASAHCTGPLQLFETSEENCEEISLETLGINLLNDLTLFTDFESYSMYQNQSSINQSMPFKMFLSPTVEDAFEICFWAQSSSLIEGYHQDEEDLTPCFLDNANNCNIPFKIELEG